MSGGAAFAPALGILGAKDAQNKADRGWNNAKKVYGTPPIFQQGGGWWDALTSPNNLLAQTAKSLLSGNGLDELQPALRSADIAGRNNQRMFAGQLAKSGLTGSGFGLGNNYAIKNQTDVNKSNILAQLPALQRENLASLFPYFSRYLGNQEFRTKGFADTTIGQGNQQAATRASQYGMAMNSLGGKGGGGGSQWQGPGGQTAPASKGAGGGGK